MPSQSSPAAPAPSSQAEAHGEAQADGAEIGENALAAEPRIRVLPGGTENAASFEFENEDHTLGNALRYLIMKNPGVEFCGYSIPHPSEPKMNVRIQTNEGTTVFDALQKGLDDLMDLCDVVTDKFATARDEFTRNRMGR